ncbi:MAG TPA: DinB family protein [Anaerolineales bacterium]|nr:DinB family protein [Anaerolineales bacterium]
MPGQISFPESDEYAPFYSEYIQRAWQRGDVFAGLSEQITELHGAFDALTDLQARFKPGPEEWSIKEVLGHLNDGERVFSYRLLRISRGDATPLPGFEQEDYVRAAGFDNSSLEDLISEFEYLRRANVIAIRNMTEEAIERCGTASGATVSARALIHILVGHVDHHMASLQEKYLPVARTLQ